MSTSPMSATPSGQSGNRRIVTITDATLRDGSHPIGHSFTPEQVARIAAGLDRAGVGIIEVSHGFGAGASSLQFGIATSSEEDRLRAAAAVIKHSRLAILLLPGIGISDDLRLAVDCGAQIARIATHCTEASIAQQHLELAKGLGMRTVGFMMMAHMVDPSELATQARVMEANGADVVYVVDSAGTMLPADVRARVEALKSTVRVEVGFHGHNNLGMAVANTLTAIESGADMVDTTLCALGAGAGNCQSEVLVAVLDKLDYHTGIDLFALIDVAEGEVRPLMRRPQVIDGTWLSIGYAGVFNSFLPHAHRAAERFGVPLQSLLKELGRRRLVDGQEDLIDDVARDLARTFLNERNATAR